MNLISKLEGGGHHPTSGLDIPPSGVEFEADEIQGATLIACGIAEQVKTKKAAKAEKKGE